MGAGCTHVSTWMLYMTCYLCYVTPTHLGLHLVVPGRHAPHEALQLCHVLHFLGAAAACCDAVLLAPDVRLHDNNAPHRWQCSTHKVVCARCTGVAYCCPASEYLMHGIMHGIMHGMFGGHNRHSAACITPSAPLSHHPCLAVCASTPPAAHLHRCRT